MVSWYPLRGEVLWQQTTFIWGYKTFQKNATAIECLSWTLLIVIACCHSVVRVVVRFSLQYNLPNLPGVVRPRWSALLRWLPSLMQTSPQSCWRQRGIHDGPHENRRCRRCSPAGSVFQLSAEWDQWDKKEGCPDAFFKKMRNHFYVPCLLVTEVVAPKDDTPFVLKELQEVGNKKSICSI